jgi:hypothetical protein
VSLSSTILAESLLSNKGGSVALVLSTLKYFKSSRSAGPYTLSSHSSSTAPSSYQYSLSSQDLIVILVVSAFVTLLDHCRHNTCKATQYLLGQLLNSSFSDMNIAALLNPAPDTHERRRSLRTRRLTLEGSPIDDSADYDPAQSLRRSKAKQTKDAPKFERGETIGHVRFAPHQTSDLELMRYLKDFKLFPCSGISAYPRHIPYSSDKKDFLTKTGRDSFEGMLVLTSLTFPADVSKYSSILSRHVVVTRSGQSCGTTTLGWSASRRSSSAWDMRRFAEPSTSVARTLLTIFTMQTIPAKAIAANPGLKDLCHSITGGALAAQGTSMVML